MKKGILSFLILTSVFSLYAQTNLSEYYFIDGFTIKLNKPYQFISSMTNQETFLISNDVGTMFWGKVYDIKTDFPTGMKDFRTQAILEARDIAGLGADTNENEYIWVAPDNVSLLRGLFISISVDNILFYCNYAVELVGTPGNRSPFFMVSAFSMEDIPYDEMADLINNMNLEITDAAG